jgi:hypothetical protein
MMSVYEMRWKGQDEADVNISVLRKSGELIRRRYRVVRDGGRWVCLGQVLKVSPA